MKASIQPETMAGAMTGSVTWKKVFTGGAPRSIAASSSERSKVIRRDCTTTATKHMEKVMCASVTVRKPRSSPTATKRSSSDEAGDHFRHDQRREHHAGEEQPAPEAGVAGEGQRCQRAEHGRDRSPR